LPLAGDFLVAFLPSAAAGFAGSFWFVALAERAPAAFLAILPSFSRFPDS
jgi:hypothetical protein